MRFLILLIFIVFARGLSAEESQTVHGRGFSFSCPRTWKVEKSSPADFKLYRIDSPAGDHMLIYEGNAADFPGAGSTQKPVPAKIGGRPALIIKSADAAEVHLDALIETGFAEWPTQIHVICRPATRASLAKMEKLLGGLIVRENPPDTK